MIYMAPKINKKYDFRWGDYFIKRGEDFLKFWKDYLNKSKRDVLFIIGNGFDPRMCIGIDSIIKQGGNGKRDCMLLNFDEGESSPSKQYKQEINANLANLKNIIINKGVIIDSKIQMFSEDGRRIGSNKAPSVIKKDKIKDYSDIIVDISAIPQALYFPIIGKLLSMYDNDKNFNLHIVVVENPSFDSGIKPIGIDEEAKYIHGFGKVDLVSTDTIPSIWMPILGERRYVQLERIRTLISPHDTHPILPFPSKNPRRGDELVIEYNELIFDGLDPRNIIYVAEQNPFEVYRKIARTVFQYNKVLSPLNPTLPDNSKCKIILSALSSKLLSMGALLAAYDLSNKDFEMGIAHVEAQGYEMINEPNCNYFKENNELFTLWIAGECYNGQ